MRRLLLIAFAVLVAPVLAPAALAVGISLGGVSALDPSACTTSTCDSGTPYIPTSLPDSGTVSASFAGNTATVGYSLSNAAFMITFGETSGVNSNDTGYVIAQLDFTPDANVDYSLDGAYGALDAEAGYDAYSVSLVDLTDSVALFVNSQVSVGTPSESFTLGQVGGDSSNSLSGSLSGSLIAGHNYRFNVQSQKANLGASGIASASGFASLTFIPEPDTGLLVMAGLFGLAYRQRRHGRAA